MRRKFIHNFKRHSKIFSACLKKGNSPPKIHFKRSTETCQSRPRRRLSVLKHNILTHSMTGYQCNVMYKHRELQKVIYLECRIESRERKNWQLFICLLPPSFLRLSLVEPGFASFDSVLWGESFRLRRQKRNSNRSHFWVLFIVWWWNNELKENFFLKCERVENYFFLINKRGEKGRKERKKSPFKTVCVEWWNPCCKS